MLQRQTRANENELPLHLKKLDVFAKILGPVAGALVAGILMFIFKFYEKQTDIHDSTSYNQTTLKLSSRSYVGIEITVGVRIWMPHNLDVDKYVDDTPIFRATNAEDWKQCNEEGKGCYCDFGTGKIYNYYAVRDEKHGGIVPSGWQLPKIGDLVNLRYQDHIFAPALKSNSGWRKRNDGTSGNGNNSKGLNIFPTGYVTPDFQFRGADSIATFWLEDPSDKHRDTKGDATSWFFMHLQRDNDSVNWDDQSKYFGYCVRCVKR